MQRTPDVVAVVFEDESLTYAELNTRANQLAHYLHSQGVGPDVLVGICVERSIEMIVGLLGILKAGGAYVPLDPSYPVERLKFMLEDGSIQWVLTQAALRENLQQWTGLKTSVEFLYLDADWEKIALGCTDNLKNQVDPENLAYIIYTSGSTGIPKGVAVTHSNVLRLILSENDYAHFGADEVFLQFAPLAFDASTFEIWGCLLNGARLVVFSGFLPTSLELARFIENHEVTTAWLTAGLFHQMVDAVPQGLGTLRQLLAGGDVLSVPHLIKAQQQWAGCRFVNGYGPTENTTFTCCYNLANGFGASAPIGRPIANTQVYILDTRLQPVPLGVSGEVYIGGDGLARSYLNCPELTAEKFLPDPFHRKSGARLYRTGDLARYLPDGNIEFLGRIDHQVKIRGFRIELGEIEVAFSAIPEVREVVVLAREDTLGDSLAGIGKYLVAYITLQAGQNLPEIAELRSRLSQTLPDYMLPTYFVQLEQLPLTPNGKLDRKALPAPDMTRSKVGYVAPRTAIEVDLAQIWADVFKLDLVGIHDNFFELGGHSLLAITLIERMRQVGLSTDIRALFSTPTIAALVVAANMDSGEIVVPPNLIPVDCQDITPDMLPLVQLTPDEIARIVKAVPGGAANIQDIYPLAPLQEGILFHHLLNQEGDAYLLPALLSFDSREGLEHFVHALQVVIQRHDILRTAVLWDGITEPAQVVWRQAPIITENIHLDPEDGDIAGQLSARFDPRHYRLDIREAPMMRGFIAEDRANERWLLNILFHHLVGDHTTLELVIAEIKTILKGREADLPTALPFRNFVAQARLGIPQAEHEVFFREMLAHIDEPTAPFGLLDVQGDGSGIEEAQREVDPALALRLRQQARRLGVSTASIMHLAWAQVLARTTGRQEVVFGTVLFGRMQGGAGADRVLGLFINTLPVCISVGHLGVQESVRQTHTQLTQLLRHEHASLALAQRCSSVQAPTPLFSALLNYRHSALDADAKTTEVQAWDGMQILAGEERTNYPLTLLVDDLGEGFVLTTQVASGVQAQRVCDYMHTTLEHLVNALEAAPQTPVHQIEVLPVTELHQILAEWNATGTEYPQDKCIHELFEAQVDRTPQAVALIFEDRQLTYLELNERANQLAHYLRSQGVGPDVLVGICVERSIEMIVGLLGILKAGGAYLPLDPSYPLDRIAFMLEDAKPVLVLTQQHLQQTLPVAGFCLDSQWPTLESYLRSNPRNTTIPANLAYVIYTSGSTGRPKGSLLQHANVSRLFSATDAWFAFDEKDTWTLFHSYAFDFSVWEIWGALLYGGKLVIVPYLVSRSPDLFHALLTQEKVTILNQTPSAFQQLIEADLRQAAPSTLTLRKVIFGGEALNQAALAPWFDRHGYDQPTLINMYGITETTVHVTYHPLQADTKQVSCIGQPIPDLGTYLLDANLQLVPVGMPGELCVAGDGLARGYLNCPDLTAGKFVPNPFSDTPGARLYRSGDLARCLPDGNIEYLGRIDQQVKICGFRIELGEIEAALSALPEVREVAVLALEDTGDPLAGTGKRLVAYLAMQVGYNLPGIAELRRRLSQTLPDYMLPTHFVQLDQLPLTSNGKLDRKALPAPDMTRSEIGYVAPRTPTEEILTRIWAEVLKLDKVGIHDNFFELGGDSIRTIAIVSKARERGLSLKLEQIFRYQTIADLVNALSLNIADVQIPVSMLNMILISDADRALLPEHIEDAYAMSRLQLGMIFHNELTQELGTYHDIFSFQLKISHWDQDVYESVLHALTQKHPILRTSFNLDQYSEPLQLVHKESHIPLSVFDLTQFDAPTQDKMIADWIDVEKKNAFDLKTAPLLKIFIHRRTVDTLQYSISFHHAIFDGWSVASFQAELFEEYVKLSATPGKTLVLQPLASSFKKTIATEMRALQSMETRSFWEKYLDGHTLSMLPAFEEGGQPLTKGKVNLPVSPELKNSLVALANSLHVPFRTVLLTAHLRVVSILSGKDDIITGLTSHTRSEEQDGDKVLGLFLNILPLRQTLHKSSWVELIRATFENELTVAPYRAYPYAQLLLENGRVPLFEIVFNYTNFHIYDDLRKVESIEVLGGMTAEATNFAMALNVSNQVGDDLQLNLAFDPARLSVAQAEKVLGYYRSILQSMSENPDAMHDTQDYLSRAEREQMLVEWNPTATYPQDQCIHELFEAQVERTPDAVALVFEDRQLTYLELNERANQLAHYLRSQGVGPDVLVGICVERSLEMIVGLLGILKAGGAYLPLDPSYPPERLAYMLDDAKPTVLLTQQRLQPTFPVAAFCLDSQWSTLEHCPRSNPTNLTLPANLAYVIYTSGSTGRPKGSLLQHANVARLFSATDVWFRFDEKDTWTLFHSYAFDFSVWEIWGALLYGGKLVIVPYLVSRSPDLFHALLAQEKVTILNQTPSAFQQLIEADLRQATPSLPKTSDLWRRSLEPGCLGSLV